MGTFYLGTHETRWLATAANCLEFALLWRNELPDEWLGTPVLEAAA